MPSQNVDVYSKEVNDGNKEKSVPSDVDCYQYSFSNMDPQDGMPLYKRKQGLQGKDQTKVLRGQGFVPTISLCAPVGLPTLALASHLPVPFVPTHSLSIGQWFMPPVLPHMVNDRAYGVL